jgi:hypothetical protein
MKMKNYRCLAFLTIVLNITLMAKPGIAQKTKDGEFLLDTSVVYYQKGADENYPATAYDGENYLIVWSRDGDIVARRVSKEGILIDTNIIYVAGDNCTSPTVCFKDSCYLIVWYGGGSGIQCKRMDACGNVLDQNPIVIGSIGVPAISCDSENYFIIWSDGAGIRSARVTTSGEVLDPGGKK